MIVPFRWPKLDLTIVQFSTRCCASCACCGITTTTLTLLVFPLNFLRRWRITQRFYRKNQIPRTNSPVELQLMSPVGSVLIRLWLIFEGVLSFFPRGRFAGAGDRTPRAALRCRAERNTKSPPIYFKYLGFPITTIIKKSGGFSINWGNLISGFFQTLIIWN